MSEIERQKSQEQTEIVGQLKKNSATEIEELKREVEALAKSLDEARQAQQRMSIEVQLVKDLAETQSEQICKFKV